MRGAQRVLMASALGLFGVALLGCSSSRPRLLSPEYGVRSAFRVTSTPAGAEVWIGPGCDAGAPLTSRQTSRRRLGRTPLSAPLTTNDLAPGGDLEFSIRFGNVRRDGRIDRADHVLAQGGSFRIDVDLATAPGGKVRRSQRRHRRPRDE